MTGQHWNLPTKVAFRFAFIFILSFIVFKNNGAFTGLQYLVMPLVEPIRGLTHWFSQHIVGYKYSYDVFTNGSGDTSYDWMLTLLLIVIAILGTIIWSTLDRNRQSYNSCYYWLTVVIRYYIAFMLINYGSIKLMHAQMPPPSLNRLMQPLGEFSPMGLAWTYLGYSKGFNIFVGVMEIMAGLLLFRKTMVLGALITAAVSINIMSVNYFFDVPVKLISTALFLLSLVLLMPYFKSMFGFFIQGNPSQISILERPRYSRRWVNKAIVIVKIIVLTVFLIQQVSGMLNTKKMMAHYFKKSALHGIYFIEENKSTLVSFPTSWMSIVFEYEGHAAVRDRQYKKIAIEPKIDTAKHLISLNNYTFDYSIQENGDVILTKKFDDRVELIKLIKQKPEDFELMKRGFNLVQEYPYNR